MQEASVDTENPKSLRRNPEQTYLISHAGEYLIKVTNKGTTAVDSGTLDVTVSGVTTKYPIIVFAPKVSIDIVSAVAITVPSETRLKFSVSEAT